MDSPWEARKRSAQAENEVEEPQPTQAENAVKEPQPTQAENAVKEPQSTQADITSNNAAAEARRLAEWHRREDALALAKRLKATQEAEKAAQEAERHKRDVAHQWRDEEEAECPPAPKAARVQSPEEWQERLRRAEEEEEELWQPPPEHVESEEEPRPQAPPSPGAEEELFQRRPPADNAPSQGAQQQQQQHWHGPQGAAIGPFVSQEVRSAVRDGMMSTERQELAPYCPSGTL
ncbi:phosphatidylglycerol--prolipoprotein diacylglyceryl transferase-like [Drosophila miranda]|uniref:phosphatidylglycerol--prolipoprotein diacylglyceryl transferase-like n=1 Tax=Drosophila miranda TaxID=7229 RepID=UPI00143FA0F9|nr:phosphatidylglycerol--prolipoprotein diacylglyceryl transferase-like [Drosophila miranda]